MGRPHSNILPHNQNSMRGDDMKLQPRRCGTCKCDRESHRATKSIVCYNISERDGKKQAVKIDVRQQACGRYRAVD